MQGRLNADVHGGNRGHLDNRGNGSSGRLVSTREHTTDGGARQELRAANGKVAAWVTGDALCKQIDGSKHILRKPHGIAFDRDILHGAEAAGAVRVWIRDRETGDVYRAELAAFWRYGVKLNRGFGDQVVLPMTFWCVQRAGEPVQLSLLRGGA